MGRGKLKMELIEKSTARLRVFQKRKEGLVRKLHQLTTLCDVRAAMIIYEPTQNQSFVWPEKKSDQIGVSETKIEVDEGKDMRKTDSGSDSDTDSEATKYPTWDDRFDSMSKDELRELSDALHAKAQIVRSRIEMLRKEEKRDDETNKSKMLSLELQPSSPTTKET